MPELPEVETIVRTLAPRIEGASVLSVRLHRDDIVQPAGTPLADLLARRQIVSLIRRAKRIVFRLDDGNAFFVHLGMTGRLTSHLPGCELQPHTHLVLKLASNSGERLDVHFRDPRRFGGIHWLGDAKVDEGLGPEPFGLRAATLAKRLEGRRRPIKSALLDQSVLAGLGNIYVDESLFAAGIHPLRLAGTLTRDEIARLNRSIKQTLRRALKHRGSTLRDYVDAEGGAGAFQRLHRVYGRSGLPCRRCKAPIQRIVLGGRSTCFCLSCQQ